MANSIQLNKKDFKSRGGVHRARIQTTEVWGEIEGFEKFHENSPYRQGKIKVKLSRKDTTMYCHESFEKGLYTYCFSC